MRVLSICISDSEGGASRAAFRIHRAARAYGVDSNMFVKNKASLDATVHSLEEYKPQNRLYLFLEWIVIKCKNKIQHIRWRRYPRRENVFVSDMRSTCIFNALDEIGFDILHLHWINMRFFPLNKLKRVKKPVVWTLHDCWPFCGICHYAPNCEKYMSSCGGCPLLHSNDSKDMSNMVWKKKSNIYHGIDLSIVCPSQWMADCAKRSSLLGGFPITVIPNCVDTDIFKPIDLSEISEKWEYLYESKHEKSYVLFGAMSATSDKRKGFAYLISALNILKQHCEKDIELVVFGADSPIAAIDSLFPIHYVGHVSNTYELVSLYNLADVMVVPSIMENLSCAIMESMACGTPVVAFSIGGNSDMIEHKVNGYLAQECNSADMASGIEWCLYSENYKSLSLNARKKIINNFTMEIIGKKYSDLYSTLA